MPGASDRARGRRKGQKYLPCLGPVTEPKAEEEDKIPTMPGASDRAKGRRGQNTYPA